MGIFERLFGGGHRVEVEDLKTALKDVEKDRRRNRMEIRRWERKRRQVLDKMKKPGKESYERFAAPATERLLEAAKERSAIAINYVNGAFQHLDAMQRSCADVLAVDWRHDLGQFRDRVGDDKALQGNLDPTALFCGPEDLRRRVQKICAGAGTSGHIFNLGHGVLPQTDPESLHVALEAARTER